MLARVFPPDVPPVTRRMLLAGAVGIPLLLSTSACTEDPPADLPADPAREALQAAREVEAATLLSLGGWSPDEDASVVTPADAREAVSAHVDALDDALSATPSATPPPSGSGSEEQVPEISTDQVVVALDAAADNHTRALRTASPEISPLLASIAASDATLAAAIRLSSR